MVGISLMSKNYAIEPSLHTKQVLQETNHILYLMNANQCHVNQDYKFHILEYVLVTNIFNSVV